MGKNLIANIPKKIAEWNQLENPEQYSGHTFRRTAASWAAEGGADLLSLKNIGGWVSSSAAEGYVEQSMLMKHRLAKFIIPEEPKEESKEKENKEKIKRKEPSSNDNPEDAEDDDEIILTLKKKNITIPSSSPFSFSNCKNCHITVNYK